MRDDDDDQDDLPDLGVEVELDPQNEWIEFREDPLSLARVAAFRPFRQHLSDEQPIRILSTTDGKLLIMEGNIVSTQRGSIG